ncbi:MAG: hypothetical protein J2P30_01675 [Actinobacteria bacterium]|nr:hypothetical protein [Actinomycetota bacterium]
MSRQRLQGLAFVAFCFAAPFIAAWDAACAIIRPRPEFSFRGIDTASQWAFCAEIRRIHAELAAAAARYDEEEL